MPFGIPEQGFGGLGEGNATMMTLDEWIVATLGMTSEAFWALPQQAQGAYMQQYSLYMVNWQMGDGNGNGEPSDPLDPFVYDEPVTPVTPATPSEYFGWGYPSGGEQIGGFPELGWLQKLQAGGQLGRSPAQKWMRGQYPTALWNWRLANAIGGLEGREQTGWLEAPTQLSRDPGLYDRLLGVQGKPMAQEWMQEQPGALWDITAAGQTGGARTPFGSFLGQQYRPKYEEWQAFHDPGAPGTTGTNWFDWLRQYMGV